MEGIKYNINEIATVTVTLLLLFFVTKAVYESSNLKSYLAEFKQKNISLQLDNDAQKEDLKYFETQQFKDLYAKESMNLLNAGEKVMVIKKNISDADFINNIFENIKAENVKNLPVLKQWRMYFNVK